MRTALARERKDHRPRSILADQAGHAHETVVIEDGAVLRSADSFGAPAALANPLPAGAELRTLETRGSWVRVSLADGTRGWLTAGTIEQVEPM